MFPTLMSRSAVATLATVAALTLLGAAVAPSPALAAGPMVKTQPGWYRVMLGDFEITALSDGSVKLPVKDLLTNTTPAKVEQALKRSHLTHPVETSVNAYLINTGTKLVMVDAGAGTLFGPTLGALAGSLKAAGYTPDQVDEIYITHLHPDHVGGLAADGKAVFPNAVVRMDKADADFWLSQANLDKAPEANKGFFKGAQAMLKPYQDAGRIKPFEGDTELVPGVRAIASHGHTPGHTIYQVESKGQKLMLWGDLMHVAAVQFPQPATTISFDTDSKQAMRQRTKAYAEAAKQQYLIGAAHLSFPGLGYLRKDAGGPGYTWLPLNYSSLK